MRDFGADVLTTLKKIATDDLNNMIDIIKLERSDTGLENVLRINTGLIERQYPECFIKLGDSEVLSEEIGMDITNTGEIYPGEVMVLFKDNTDLLFLRMEYYIEALKRIFHGYHDDSISYIIVTGGIRADVYTEQKETLKGAGVSLKIRVY